jgi:hypothetical protein
MTVLLGHPQRIATEHQIPTDGRMAGAVGFPITDRRVPPECPSPTTIGILKVKDRLTGLLEEKMAVADLPREFELPSQ